MEYESVSDCRRIAAELAANCYAVEVPGIGITGADRDRFEKEILFPIPEKTDFTVYAADYGVVAGSSQDMRLKLADAAAALKELGEGTKKLVLPAGEIRLCDDAVEKHRYSLELEGLKDLYVDCRGATFMMDMTLRGVRIDHCENVVLANLNFDRFELPYFMGTVESFDAVRREAIVTVNEGYDIEDGYPAREYLEFDPDTKEPLYHGNFLYNNSGVDGTVTDIKSFRLLEGRRCRIEFGCEVHEAPAGTGFVMTKTMYGPDTIAVTHSRKIMVENVNVYCTPGMGIRGNSSDDLYFNRANVCCKPGTDRLMSVTADAMHFIDCKEDLHITNTLLENSHDDAINIHGMFQMIVETDPANRRVRLDVARSVRFGRPVKGNELTIPFREGDRIELSADKTLDFKALLTVKKCYPDEEYGFWAEFDEDFTAAAGDIMSNVTRTPRVLLRNSILRNKRNRGILLQTRDSVIENCTFYNVIMPGICIFCDCLNWYESLNPRNIIIRNNKFINDNIKPNNFGDFGSADIDICVYGQGGFGKAGLIRGIDIAGNAFVHSGNANVSIRSARDITVRNNFMYRPCSETTDSPENCAVYVASSDSIVIEDNVIVPASEEGFAAVAAGSGADRGTIRDRNRVLFESRDA